MKAYQYNEQGLYIGDTVTDRDPLVEGREVFPSNTTELQPPNEVGKVAVFTIDDPLEHKENKGVSGSWSLVEDHRGTTVYDTTSQEASVVDYLGEVKPTHTAEKPASKWQEWNGTDWVGKKLTGAELEEWKEERFTEINGQTDSNIAKGFDYDGAKFSLSREAQLNWSTLSSKNDTGNFPAELAVSTKDDGEYILKKEKATEFFALVFNTVVIRLAEGRQKKLKIKALTEHTYEATNT